MQSLQNYVATATHDQSLQNYVATATHELENDTWNQAELNEIKINENN
jgi:hypothetical protein